MAKQPWILIVDDDDDVKQMLAELLVTEGYDVEVAANGAEAIDMLERADRPCAVILDLLMPGVVGQELIEFLRSDERLAEIPLAIVSGSPHLAPAGHRVFTKPVPARALLEFIRARC